MTFVLAWALVAAVVGLSGACSAPDKQASPTVSPTVIEGGSCCATTYTFTRRPRP